ncbi:MAG TPA: ATP-binding cassette domain-containing protein [Syntrophomonadaceae bacterium]|nr:ATP-binding cassette domain-containing protein [Syntrophomonadaceae bacterium]
MLEAQFTKKLWHFTLGFDIQAGNQIVVLWGPSGAGKTTILHCLAGLTDPSEGYIKLDDHMLYSSQKNINLPARLRHTGYLFQDYALFPHMTVRQNILYGLKNQKKSRLKKIDPLEMLDSFGIRHLIDRYPRHLSGGEKQRVALARALLVQPRLLLLDEPFNALDRSTRINLRKELKSLQEQWGIPFLLVTHDEEDAQALGDVIISLDQGQIMERTYLQ